MMPAPIPTPAVPQADAVHDILHQTRRRPLDAIFAPAVVAVIGATESEHSVGRSLLENLIRGEFRGAVYPVNPKRPSVLGLKAYPRVGDIPEQVDLAVITTPAATVPALVRECAAAGVPGAIIISAGFKETGAAGVELERQVLAEARKGKMRVIGPNCLGVMNPHAGLNATFASRMAHRGSVGFLSQSGALCTAVLDWSLHENVGFSAFVSIGSMLDVDWGDLIYYLGDDPRTKSIVMYMETIGDARSFLSAAREVALTKPIIVIKVGRTEAAARAAASHTGSMTGSDEVLRAAFRRVGVLRVETIAELFDMAEVLGKQPPPRGPRLTIVTNAGGPGVLATDMLIGSGGALAELSPATLDELNTFLPAAWSHGNPIDILGDAGADRYARAVQAVAQDPGSDGLLVILTPQAMTDGLATAVELTPFAHGSGKPVLACWMGGEEVQPGRYMLNAAGIPSYEFPDTAARAFHYMWRYRENLRVLYETPALLGSHGGNGDAVRAEAGALIAAVRQRGRTILTEFESKQLFQVYGIPTVDTRIARSAAEAVACATAIGFPVVLKLHSETITHKTDVGGVQLNLGDAGAVQRAWERIATAVNDKVGPRHFLGVTVQPMIKPEGCELILGSSSDPQLGPVLVFGAGGQLVEVFQDRALGLPPLNQTLARRMMEQTRIFQALQGVRGRPPVNLAALEEILVRFSYLVVEQPWIAEIDINPLLASADRLLALDARVVLHPPDTPPERLPRPAIRPYPVQYVAAWVMRDGTPVTIRPLGPEDEPLLARFHETLSEESVYHRYFAHLQLEERIAHARLTRMCACDYDREIALVAEHQPAGASQPELLGAGRLSKVHGLNEATFALIIRDAYQGRGLGTELLQRLVRIGRDERLDRITATMLPGNHGMQAVSRRVGFTLQPDPAGQVVTAELVL